MTMPIADDFSDIAARLKQLEEEKAKRQSEPLPDVQPIYGYGLGADYDPA